MRLALLVILPHACLQSQSLPFPRLRVVAKERNLEILSKTPLNLSALQPQ